MMNDPTAKGAGGGARSADAGTAERSPAATGPIVRLEDLSIDFETPDGAVIRAVDGVTLDVTPGEFLTIVGPSGCGKSTLLNVIVGLLEPSAGCAYYKGQVWQGVNTEIGYVTQEDNLFPWRTTLGSAEFGMEVRGYPREERRRRAMELMAAVGLSGFENHYRHQLSGGMRQRVNIIRTLAYRPEVILMDEPFGPLDAHTRIILQDQLLNLWQQERATVVFITHDLAEAITLSDRVAIMSRRPGRIRAIEPVDLPRPRDVFRLSTQPEFRALYDRLWEILRTEVQPDAASPGDH